MFATDFHFPVTKQVVMKVFNRIFLVAILAGGIAGLFLAEVEHFTVIPLILEAETFEVAGEHVHAGNAQIEDVWAPENGAERTFYTVMNSVIVGIGFGLLLTACYTLRQSINWRSGILWGLSGFAAFSLAPALGLPPELPGDAAAGLEVRQIWWLLTVIVTAAGLWVIAFQPVRYVKLAGVALIALPHLVGAPQPEVHASLVPEDLKTTFIFTTLAANAMFWIVLGTLSAFLYNRAAKNI